MKKILVPFADTHQFSPLVDEYLSGDPKLNSFYRFAPEPASFHDALKQRENFKCNRQLLANRLMSQYGEVLNDGSPGSVKVRDAIQLLNDQKCFTVTTGHQLNIFTGPLYSIYKIATTIKLAMELRQMHPSLSFVPVFWMASEDHDFAEINNTRIFGKPVSWERDAAGAVGRMDPSGMRDVVAGVREIMGSDARCMDIFEQAYLNSTDLAVATRKIIHALFSEHGLVVIDGDDAQLKREFVGEMRDDILNHTAFHAVESVSKKLGAIHKTLVQPREINVFYLSEGSRERIVKKEEGFYQVLNTQIKFSSEELLENMEAHPENFSPNVVLRPLYQEKILPNLAYIGGPGEVSYWLQFMGAFDAAEIPFPVLMLRNCLLLLDKNSAGKLEKLGIAVPEIFKSADYLVLKVLENSSDVHVGTDHVASLIQKGFHELAEQWARLDPSLVPGVEAEHQKLLKGLTALEEKARRALKRKNESVVTQVKNLKEKLFPGGGLQERTDNFLPYYCRNNNGFINEVIAHANPFEKDFIVLVEEN